MITERVEIFKFKINGIEIASERSRLSAGEILKLAEEHQAIPGSPEDYMLVGEKGEYRGIEEIDFEIDELLISIPTAPTQVA